MSNAPIQEALKNIRKELLKYCHHKKCRFFVRCPTDHPKCKKKLGLDTAIAWQVAKHIAFLLSLNRINPDTSLIQDRLDRINQLINVINLSSKKFSPLLTLLNEAVFWIKHLERKPNEKGG